jgi:hypothetical protein
LTSTTYVSIGADFDFLILFPAAAAALSAVSSASPSTTQLPPLTIQFSVHKASVNSVREERRRKGIEIFRIEKG